MYSHFPYYYRATRQNLLDNFENCVFMFDACSLLDIFRLRKETVENIFRVLEHYKAQIYIPHHAAEEYNNNVIEVLETQIKNIEESRKAFDAFARTFKTQRNYPYITDTASKLINKLKNQIDKDFSEQINFLEEQLIHGEYQNKLSKLLDGKVLEPLSDEEIFSIKNDGEIRYANKIPPGWKDAPKGDNRYGDLINWNEILKFVKENSKSVIFVSNDVKEDWVMKVRGKKFGVQPLLLKEFYESVDNRDLLFHVYTLDSFLTFINERNEVMVSDEAVENVKISIEKPVVSIKAFSNLNEQLLKSMKMPEYMEQIHALQAKLASLYRPITILGEEISGGQDMSACKKQTNEVILQKDDGEDDKMDYHPLKNDDKGDERIIGNSEKEEEKS